MKSGKYYLVQSITIYRIVAAPVLIALVIFGQYDLFKWLLPVSFFTDLIDGYLARKFRVQSELGSKLDSIGDDLTFLAATIGVFVFKLDFILAHIIWVSVMLGLYFLQLSLSLIKYRKITSFHTYLGKTATLFQGLFLIFIFILPEPLYFLFYLAAVITILDLAEEIVIIFYLKDWQSNVKGMWWVMRDQKVRSLMNAKSTSKFKLPPTGKRRAFGS